MALSGLVPPGVMPAWMYHAQLPPPTGAFNDQVYGITWVDLVFPFFLFSMGAAIPLSLAGRADKGVPPWKLVLGLFGRGVLLAAYALIGPQLRAYAMSNGADVHAYWIALAGFGFIALMLMRWQETVPKQFQIALTVAGWAGALICISAWSYPDNIQGFNNSRVDVILMVLANVAVTGGVIWLVTRVRPLARWACFAVVAAIFLSFDRPGVSQFIWQWDPATALGLRNGPNARFVPIFYHFDFEKYLLIVIPGTFVGDLIRASSGENRPITWPIGALWAQFALVLVGPAACAISCVGLLNRQVVGTTIWLGALVGAVWLLLSRFPAVYTALPARLFRFGAPLLLIGLLTEPVGGGIRKDEATFSYFLVTAGLAAMSLASLAVLWPGIRRNVVWRLVSDTGVNAIMGYLVITNLTAALVGLFGLDAWVAAQTLDPWTQFGWACVKTSFVAFATAFFTRQKVFLRA